jgi:predicted nucleic acid-binding protein
VRLLFDTGALIAVERRSQRILEVFRDAIERRIPVMVPAPVVGEWWRGRTDRRELILASLVVESFDVAMARVAGEALARVRGATLVDAIVMASAARSGAIVYTADFDDLDRLRAHFPSVRVLET